MRFIPDGPDIPNELLKKWRAGEVVFLAGAGVSMPAGLPSFQTLALEVYRVLNDPLYKPLKRSRRCKHRSSQERIVSEVTLSPEQRVEAALFFANELDRLFSAMEARIDQDARGRAKSRRVRDAVEKILRGKVEFGNEHKDLIQLSLPPSGLGNSMDGPMCRITTTNFDLLLESAWQVEIGKEVKSFDARIAPRPGAHDFEGVIHLHGMLHENSARPGQFVISSRDFARVYLRSGVIANYIYDLIRKYTVVLIGYTANDPPMRYLMDTIGEDASLFDDMNHPYAIAERDTGPDDTDGMIATAIWRAKNITPILYQKRSGKKQFGPLWETINEWARWARSDIEWVNDKLRASTNTSYDIAPPFSRAFVQNLLTVLELEERESAVQYLRDNDADFSWIEVITAVKHD